MLILTHILAALAGGFAAWLVRDAEHEAQLGLRNELIRQRDADILELRDQVLEPLTFAELDELWDACETPIRLPDPCPPVADPRETVCWHCG